MTDYLPIQLARIHEISDTCKTSSVKVVDQFSNVMKTMDQMSQATLVKQGKVKEAKEHAEARLKIEEDEKVFYEEQVRVDKINSEKLAKEVQERTEEYKKAFNDIPGAGTMVLLGMAETVTKVAPILAVAGAGSLMLGAATGLETAVVGGSAVASMLGSKATSLAEKYMDKNTIDGEYEDSPNLPIRDEDAKLYRFASEKLNGEISAGLSAILKKTDGEPMNFKLAHGGDEDGFSVTQLKAKVNALMDKIEETRNDATRALYAKVITSANNMQALLNKIENVDRSGESKETDVNKIKKEYLKLTDRISKLAIERTARAQENTLNRPGPGMLAKLTEMGQGVELTQSALKNAHLKVECARAQQKSSEERLEKAQEKAMASQRAKMEIEKKLSQYNLQTTELPELLKVIGDGLRAMGELKQEWSKLLQFFTAIANIIATAMGPAMKSFEDYARQTGDNRLKRGDAFQPSDLIKQQIYEITKEAGKRAFVVHRISGCYSAISKQHMMPLVAKLNSMIALDKATDGHKIEQCRRELEGASKSARYAINVITQENISRARLALQSRMMELNAMVDNCIPALPTEERLAIRLEAEQMTRGEVAEDPDIDLADY